MLMHADISAWTYTFAAGVVLGIIYHITGSLWASIIYHSVNNLIGVVAAYIYSQLGYEDMLTQSYEATFQGQGGLLAVGVIVLVIAAVIFAGISFLLFWALKKVSPKKEPVERLNYKESKITYVPYILGTFLLLVMTVLPVISQILQG
jgi:membrane protease YdiL (CAAX protease family)